MLLVTIPLLLIVALSFGFSRRPWWQIGTLALFTSGLLLATQFYMDDWRHQVGLSHRELQLDRWVIIGIVGSLLLSAYGGYALGLLYSRSLISRSAGDQNS
jgi:hypothetical protein